jgi:hypothetical protein
MARKIFISHESVSKREAVSLKELLEKAANDVAIFLTSDWYSLESGAPWFDPLVTELRQCNEVVAIITRPQAFQNLWINFEIGVAFGSGKFPKILVFGGVLPAQVPHPIGGLQLIDTGDTNRWTEDLRKISIDRVDDYRDEFARLFKQKPG